jgi:dihydrofolate reductase
MTNGRPSGRQQEKIAAPFAVGRNDAMPTTLTVDLFISTDGFAGSDGLPGYFGYSGPDLEAWIADSTAPTVSIMGRRTYEMLASLPEEHRDAGWEQMAHLQTVVFSHTLQRAEWPNARTCHDDLGEEIA